MANRFTDWVAGFHHDDNSGLGGSPDQPPSLAGRLVGRLGREIKRNRLENSLLLLTPENSISAGDHDYYFHRSLLAPDATPEQQRTLLRRVRRMIHSQVETDQNNLRYEQAHQEAQEATHGPVLVPPQPTQAASENFILNTAHDGISTRAFLAGDRFFRDHRELTERLGDHPMQTILATGEDILALEEIRRLRAQYAPCRSPDPGIESLRDSVVALPQDALRLYDAYEIPFVHAPTISTHGRCSHLSACISINDQPIGQSHRIATPSTVAAHEMCHALLNYDFALSQTDNDNHTATYLPDDIRQASEEYRARGTQIAQDEPSVRQMFLESQGERRFAWENLHHAMREFMAFNKVFDRRAECGQRAEIEDVCNFYALRQVNQSHEREALRLFFPKMMALCDQIDANANIHLAQAENVRRSFDNPERDAIFEIIQRDNPLVMLSNQRAPSV